jgi:hypothetical protein
LEEFEEARAPSVASTAQPFFLFWSTHYVWQALRAAAWAVRHCDRVMQRLLLQQGLEPAADDANAGSAGSADAPPPPTPPPPPPTTAKRSRSGAGTSAGSN